MPTVSQIDDVPSDTPRMVRRALEVCADIEADAHTRTPWGTLTGVAVRFVQRFGQPLGVQVSVVQGGAGVHRAGSLLREVMQKHELNAVPGAHVGMAFLAEGLDGGDDVVASLADLDPEELQVRFHDLVATGQATQFRIVVAVLDSGWRFVLRRLRGADGVSIDLVKPGEPWPAGSDSSFIPVVEELNEKLGAL